MLSEIANLWLKISLLQPSNGLVSWSLSCKTRIVLLSMNKIIGQLGCLSEKIIRKVSDNWGTYPVNICKCKKRNYQHSCTSNSMSLHGLRQHGVSLVKWAKFHRKMSHRSGKWLVPWNYIRGPFLLKWRTFSDRSYPLLWFHRWTGKPRTWASLQGLRQIPDQLFGRMALKVKLDYNLSQFTSSVNLQQM